jgi:hypothetical protein
MYESDITKFMRQYLAQHPEEIESQRKGRGAWWDKTPRDQGPVPPMRHSPKAGGNEATFEPLAEKDAG